MGRCDGSMANPLQYFAELRDPRLPRTRRHLLPDILWIAIAAILSGASGWDDMERFGKAKREWLKSFLALPHGIPSHDTFNRVLAALDPEELERGFVAWVSSIARLTAGEHKHVKIVGTYCINGRIGNDLDVPRTFNMSRM